MFKKNFKLGLFAFNASSGSTITNHKKKWKANTDEIIKLVKDADECGLDFLLPVARWSDWGGRSRPHKNTFETLSLTSALSMITKKIYLFSTIHANYIHPIIAAKALTSISKFSNNRIGMNFVCGWNKEEYEMFNIDFNLSSSDRYKYGEEWLKIFNKLIDPKIDKFSFKGKYFKIKNGQIFPKVLNKNFVKISAAFSKDGRKFAGKHFDVLLTMFNSLDTLKKTNEQLKNKSKNKIQIFNPVHLIVKKSKTEAEEFYHEYSSKNQDTKAVDNFINNLQWSNKKILASYLKQLKQRVSGSLGSFTIIGDKKSALEQINSIYKSKTDGIAMTFFDYSKDFKYFRKNLLNEIRKF